MHGRHASDNERDCQNRIFAPESRPALSSFPVLVHGLSMPHSPRVHDGRNWLLESGHGTVSVVDLDAGRAEPITRLPGFTRGLDFYRHFAFVGLSQVRETAIFSGNYSMITDDSAWNPFEPSCALAFGPQLRSIPRPANSHP